MSWPWKKSVRQLEKELADVEAVRDQTRIRYDQLYQETTRLISQATKVREENKELREKLDEARKLNTQLVQQISRITAAIDRPLVIQPPTQRSAKRVKELNESIAQSITLSASSSHPAHQTSLEYGDTMYDDWPYGGYM